MFASSSLQSLGSHTDLKAGTSKFAVHRRTSRANYTPTVAQISRTDPVSTARQLYEEVWSTGKIRLLNTIMAEDHVQRDMIWQPDNVSGGRDRMKKGILAYRAAYPDIRFKVQDAALCDQSTKVFVSWTATGTNLGPIREQPATGRTVNFSGVTIVTFNLMGQIVESAVYRQAPADEASYYGSRTQQPGGAQSQ